MRDYPNQDKKNKGLTSRLIFPIKKSLQIVYDLLDTCVDSHFVRVTFQVVYDLLDTFIFYFYVFNCILKNKVLSKS